MKIYGYTIVNSEGFLAGNESATRLFDSKTVRNKAMRFDYEDWVNDSVEEFGSDAVEHYKSNGMYVIQLPESHIQFEAFEQEVL